jgi:hypothetical protein
MARFITSTQSENPEDLGIHVSGLKIQHNKVNLIAFGG